MPHSTQSSSSSTQTFTLADDQLSNEQAEAASNNHASVSSFGVAVTSPPAVEDKSRLSFGLQERPASTAVDGAYDTVEAKKSEYVERRVSSRAEQHGINGRDRKNHEPPRHRSQFSDDDHVPLKDTFTNSARDKVLRSSPIIAELKTNVIIKDEFTLVTDLSYHLAQRYSRPESCVMIKVDHSACLALGGGFEPCYILNISVIPSQMSTWANRRNAALIQSFMAEILSVPAHRGVIKFEAVPEDCFALNGNTVQGQLDKVERGRTVDAKRPAASPHRKSMSSFNVRKSETRPNGIINGAENLSNTASEKSTGEKYPRPRTSHGTHSTSEFDGLRSDDDQAGSKESRLTNGRSKTPTLEQTSREELVRSNPVPPRTTSRSSTPQPFQPQPPLKSSMRPSLTPKPLASNVSLTSSSIGPNTTQQTTPTITTTPPHEIRPRHLENIAILSKKFEPPTATSTTTTTAPSAALAAATTAAQNSSITDSTAANIAKRRATTTTTPPNQGLSTSASAPLLPTSKLSSMAPAPPPIPPEPTRFEVKSIRSLRLGSRRKELFAAIKRGFRDDSGVGAKASM